MNMFKRLIQRKYLSWLITAAMCLAGFTPLITITVQADENTGIQTYATDSDLSPIIKQDGGTWYYYVNGEKDLSYNGLATNGNDTFWVEDGVVTFTYNDSFNGGGNGGWKIDDSKVVEGGNLTVKEDMGNYLADDNSFTGKLIVGDSRNEQMYAYNNNSYVNYDRSSFNATWGGKYDQDSSSYTTTGKDSLGVSKLETMMTYAKESLECLGYCDVYLFSSINDTQTYSGAGVGTEDPKTAIEWETSAASSIAGVTATFNGETVKPTMHIIAMINGQGNYDVTTRGGDMYVANWNNTLQSACTSNGWEFLDWTECLGGDNNGYRTDNIHYNTTTLENLWANILDCPHEYKTYTKAATCIETGRMSQICIKCGDVKSTSELSKTDHTYDSGKVTTEPTCTQEGVMTYTCTVCGATKTEAIAATGHTWGEGVVTLEPTATEDGIMTYICTKCGETKNEEIPANGDKGDTSGSGNTGDTGSGETGDTGDTGNTGNTGDSGNDGGTDNTGTEASKVLLGSVISEVEEEMNGLTKDNYTEESWKVLEDALSLAQAVFDDENATQEEIDVAMANLEDAFANLEKAEDAAKSSDDDNTKSNITGSRDDTSGSDTSVEGTANNSDQDTDVSGEVSDENAEGDVNVEVQAAESTGQNSENASKNTDNTSETEVVQTDDNSYTYAVAIICACASAAAVFMALARRRCMG